MPVQNKASGIGEGPKRRTMSFAPGWNDRITSGVKNPWRRIGSGSDALCGGAQKRGHGTGEMEASDVTQAAVTGGSVH